ncbi:MAG: DUF4157 domain-containing protein [Pseudomonadota bacterium]
MNEVLTGQGQALDAKNRRTFGRRFGHDFSRVRVHADAEAGRSAAAVDALAYTVGRHVVFRNGFRADRVADRALLAHELAHVVQQGFADVPADTLAIGPEGDALECEADRAAGVDLRSAASGVEAQAWSAPLRLQRAPAPLLQRAKEKPTCDTDQASLPYRFDFESSAGGSWSRKILRPTQNGFGGDIRADRKVEGLGMLDGFLKLFTCGGSEEKLFEFEADGKYHSFDFPGLDNDEKYSFLVGKKTGTGTIKGNGFLV